MAKSLPSHCRHSLRGYDPPIRNHGCRDCRIGQAQEMELETRRLAAVRSLGLLDTPQEEEFTELAQLAAAICGVSSSLITLLDEQRQFHKAKIGLIEADEIARSEGFCHHAIQQDDVFVVEDASLDYRFSQNPLVLNRPAIRFYAGAPLTTEGGLKVGALCVLDDAARSLNTQQIIALSTLARQVVARMELRQKRVQLEETMLRVRNSEALFRTFADNIPFNIYLKDPTGAMAFYNKHLAEHFQISATDWLGKQDSDLWPATVAEASEKQDKIARQTMQQVESAVTLPRRRGGLSQWKVRRVPYEMERGEIWLAGVAIDVTEQMEREAALLRAQADLTSANALLHASALTDELTGLWNRRAFNARIEQEIATCQKTHSALGLIMLDVDNFKSLNDQFGHPFGDQILRRVASLLATHVRTDDIACRYGGEEFVLLIPRAGQAALEALAERIIRHIEQTVWPERKVTLSLGLATYSATRNTSQLLVAAADDALYDAKAAGKACWRLRQEAPIAPTPFADARA